MKSKLLILILVVLTAGLTAQTNYKIKDADFSVSGTSNLHDWTSQVTEVSLTGTFVMDGTAIQDISNLKVTIPVKSIKSDKGSIMNGKTHKALDAGDHPNITYMLKDVKSVSKEGSIYRIVASGDLTIAGKTKTIDLIVKGNVSDSGTIEVLGVKKIKMTDYGIDPPTALLGTLTTGDEVILNFNLTLTR